MTIPCALSIHETGTVSSPAGFRAAGITAGFKKSGKPDLAMIFSDRDCTVAGTFTSNLFPAAPVQLCRERVTARTPVRAVVINSGIANACTGQEGYRRACESAAYAARKLGVGADRVLVSSTGRIGDQLPMELIQKGIDLASAALSPEGGMSAALAIMTTDTKPKHLSVSFLVNGRKVTVGGMTKGAGMIAPGMLIAKPHATMLCYLTTDAAVSPDDGASFLEKAVSGSFNRISVDNDMSTNDTCLLLANGASGVTIHCGTPEADLFQQAVNTVAETLARAMVMDGEGSTKFITVEVKGARNEADAARCARAIADSMLCKTAWFGGDPNWGRVLAAAGYSGAQFDPADVSLDYDEKKVVRDGMDAGTPESELCEVMKRRQFTVHINLGAGDASFTRWTSDISYDYVKINADYHT